MIAWVEAARAADPWEARFDAGAEIGASSFGVVDVAVKKGPWSAALYTDTLDLRYAPEGEHGRAWVGLRTSTFAAGLLILPWEDGAPVPEKALGAGYTGPVGGGFRYLPHGLYAGASGSAHLWWFYAEAPPPTPVGTADAVLGWWKPWGNAELQAGTDVDPSGWMPHARVTARLQRPLGVSPLVELRAGAASGQNALTFTRLGGLSPYVVPLAGAAIAEFRVEDYAAVRLGPTWASKSVRLAAFADAAIFDRDRALGFGASVHVTRGRCFADVAAGGSPGLLRQRGRAVGGWVNVGWQGPLGKPPPPA